MSSLLSLFYVAQITTCISYFCFWFTCHSALVFAQQKSLGSPSIRALYINKEKSICIPPRRPEQRRSSITAWWHGELAGEPTRTPGLIVLKAKWQWGLSVVSNISWTSLKIWLDSACYPFLQINLISHTQNLYCMSHPGYKLQALHCPLNSNHDSQPLDWENNCSFCFIAHLILCWHTFHSSAPHTCSYVFIPSLKILSCPFEISGG